MSDDVSTDALLAFHPIFDSLVDWKAKYVHLLSNNDRKSFEYAAYSIGDCIYNGLAKDKRYIYDRGEPKR